MTNREKLIAGALLSLPIIFGGYLLSAHPPPHDISVRMVPLRDAYPVFTEALAEDDGPIADVLIATIARGLGCEASPTGWLCPVWTGTKATRINLLCEQSLAASMPHVATDDKIAVGTCMALAMKKLGLMPD